jgi:hypothetical protein
MSAMREDALIVDADAVTDETPPDAMVATAGGKVMPVGKRFTPENNPGKLGGRPKGLARRIRDMVGDDPARVANVLFDILEDPTARNADRIAAAREILDRGWGKAPAYAPIEGGDPLEASELDRAIRDIADQLVARRAHPTLDAQLVRREIEDGVRPELG